MGSTSTVWVEIGSGKAATGASLLHLGYENNIVDKEKPRNAGDDYETKLLKP